MSPPELSSVEWLRFLAEASELLSTSLDYSRTLESVAQLCVQELADWCLVHVRDESGELHCVVVEHLDREKRDWVEELVTLYPPTQDTERGAMRVATTGQAEFYPHIPDQLLQDVARDERHLQLLRRLGMSSALIVPLTARHQTFGAITLIAASLRYSEADLEMARELARRAGTAIDNAILHREAQQAVLEKDRLLQELQAQARALDEQREWLNVTLTSIGDAVIVTDAQGKITFLNPVAEQVTGWTVTEATGLLLPRVFDIYSEATGEPVENPVDKVLRTGTIVGLANHTFLKRKDGTNTPIDDSAAPIRSNAGEILGVILVFRDIRERKLVEDALHEEARITETLHRIGSQISAQLEVGPLVELVTEEGTQLTGAQFGAFFYNSTNSRGDAYMLYHVAGVPREHFSKFPMPRKTEIFAPTFDGSGTLRSDDITKDPRYGHNEPYNGMPQGHLPVRSYLAVPVKSRSGDVLGGLFFGHSEAAVFTERSERLMEGVAAQAAVAMDNAQLYAESQRAAQRITSILESVTDAFLSFDAEWRFTFLNPQAERILGRSREEMLGKCVWDLFPEAVGTSFHEAYLRAVREQCPVELTEYYAPFERWFELTAYPGESGLSVYFRDVTERKKIESALQLNERRFRSLVEATSQIVWTCSRDGEFVEDQPTWREFTGQTLEQLLGNGWLQAIHPDDRESTRLNWQDAITRQTSYSAEQRLLRALDGSWRYMLVRAVPVMDDTGAISEWVGTHADITERKIAENALRSSQAQLQAIMDNSNSIVFLKDVEGRYLLTNRRFEEILGLQPGEAIGRTAHELLPADLADRLRANDLQVLQQDKAVRAEEAILQTDGKKHIFISNKFPLHDESGKVYAVGNVAADITERITAEEEIRRINTELAIARDQAVEASQAKSTFLANMSHELRTPLNAIIGYAEMLEEEVGQTSEERTPADLRKIQTAGRHLLSLINDILDLSKIEAGKMELFVQPLDLRELVRDLTDTVDPLLQTNNNQLIVNCPDDIGSMQSDETKIRQILLNLLGNAVKFTENGKVELTLSREEADGTPWIVFRVSDTGMGMSPEEINRLFQDFTQLDASTTRRHGGTGLGLAISRRFARMMGGDIVVSSTRGVGSVFTFRVPEIVSSPVAPAMAAELLAQVVLEPRENISYRPNTILVIDDDPFVHDLLRRTLEKDGYEVVGALDGLKGLELARRLHPLAITLDIMMPKIDGWCVLTELKGNPETADIPVIVLSVVEDKNLGYALGAADYLTKPLHRDRLLGILNRFACDLKHCQVLVVEDDADTLALLARTLSSTGCSVTTAADGMEAIERLQEQRYDLVLLDLMMPGMDGFQFLEEKRKLPEAADTPVIVMTAKNLSNAERSELTGSVSRILEKGSYSRDQLLREICDLVMRHSRRAGSKSD